MKHLTRFLLGLVLALVVTSARAQTPVYQSGSITAGNPTMWTANRFIGDATLLGGFTQMLITSSTPTSCINSAATTGAYNQLCFGALNLAGTAGTLTYSAVGGASTLPFQINANGGTASFNGSALTMGVAGSQAGSLLLSGSTSGAVTIKTANAAGTWNMILPTTAGSLNGPLLSGAGSTMAFGTVSGSTTAFATVTGSGGVNNNCVAWDGSGNIKDTGASCASSGVNSGTAGQLAYYATSGGTVSGNADVTVSAAALTIGRAATSQGSVALAGAAGGAVTLTGPSSITSYSITFPSAACASGQGLVATNGSGTFGCANAFPGWQGVKSTGFNASSNQSYCVDTTSGTITVTLPASPADGDQIQITDCKGTFSTNNATVARNGNNVMGSAANMTVSRNYASFILRYVSANTDWRIQ